MKSLFSVIAIIFVLCVTSTVCDINIQDRRIRSSKQLDDHRIVNAVDRRISDNVSNVCDILNYNRLEHLNWNI